MPSPGESSEASAKTPIEPLFAVCGLYRSFDDGAVEALRGVDFAIAEGEFTTIQGPSGCGKSTLLHILGTLDEPTGGDVRFRGKPFRQIRDRARFRASTIGFVFQSFHLLPTLSALENVEIPMLEMPWPRKVRRERAVELLAAVGLSDRMGHLPSKLSGGERQRVAIARSLSNEPAVLLADEPTGNLDSASSVRIMELLTKIHRERAMALVVVTHDPEVARHAGRIVRMLDGRIVEDVRSEEAR
jgi:putative ABC transport system ATP-binding protein